MMRSRTAIIEYNFSRGNEQFRLQIGYTYYPAAPFRDDDHVYPHVEIDSIFHNGQAFDLSDLELEALEEAIYEDVHDE